MKTAPRALLFLLLLVILAYPAPAFAQYMFLDLNGDGASTAADTLIGNVPADVDVYLRTDRNRNGTTVTCSSGQPFSIVSYEFILRAAGGTVTWGAFSGGLFPDLPDTAYNTTDFYAGSFPQDPALLPAGLMRLGRIQVTAVAGAPVLAFARATPLLATFLTSFGTECAGADSDNTMELGNEWTDADGTFRAPVANVSGKIFQDRNSTGGCSPQAGEPLLAGWLVTLSPSGLTALTSRNGAYEFLNVPAGSYNLLLTLPSGWAATCPGSIQAVTVVAGQTYPNLNFGVRNNTPPVLAPLVHRSALPGHVTTSQLFAKDDGSSVTFTCLGPSFVSVSGSGPKSATLRFQPQPTDTGSYTYLIRASDGVSTCERMGTVTLMSATGVAAPDEQAEGKLVVSITQNATGSAPTLSFQTFTPGRVRVILYDLQGRRVRVLEDQPMAPAGNYEVAIPRRNEAGGPIASGIYFFRVDTSQGSKAGRAIVLK